MGYRFKGYERKALLFIAVTLKFRVTLKFLPRISISSRDKVNMTLSESMTVYAFLSISGEDGK